MPVTFQSAIHDCFCRYARYNINLPYLYFWLGYSAITYFHPIGLLLLQTLQYKSTVLCTPVLKRFVYYLPYFTFMLC